jgi:hypothetical protein
MRIFNTLLKFVIREVKNMTKRIMSIFTLLIVSIVLLVPGLLSVEKTNIQTNCCGMQIDCSMLISDNTKIIEINNAEDIVWQYSIGSVDAERLSNGNTLIAGGFLVKEVDYLGTIKWQYNTGLLGVTDVERLSNNNTLITDSINNFVIEVSSSGVIVWQYNTVVGFPMDAERLANGNTLIVNNLLNSVIEVNNGGSIVWEYSTGLWSPTDAERLSNGNTLITDYLNGRVIEVNTSGGIVWQKTGLLTPKDAERLSNGNTLIVEYDNNNIIEVDNSGTIIWSYSTALVQPNDAEVIPNQPPTAPFIIGPLSGLPNIIQFFSFLSEDPGGHTIYYWIDWGDGTNTGWIGPFLPGTLIPRSHTWTTQGIYSIKAKAKDVCIESDWSEHEINMPRNKAIQMSPFLNFLQSHPNMLPLLQLLFQ